MANSASRQVGRSLPSAGGQVAAAQLARSRKPSPLISIFVFSLALPFFFYLGPTRLSPYRLVLVVTFIPTLMAWLSGSIGRTRLPDVLMLLAATWGAGVLVNLHGIDKGLQSAGIFFIETFGAFLLARRYIRDVFAFRRMVRSLVLMVLFLLPFAVYENVAGSPILIELFGKMFPVYQIVIDEPRLGLRRAQGPFEHFILFGFVCSSAFALSFYVFGAARRRGGLLAPGLVAMAVFSSLSAGALLSVVVQAILIVWDKITASVTRRWAILATIIITAFLVVNLASNRTPFEVFISYLTFDADTAYMRVQIWYYGTQSVVQHPIFGLGLDDWERPSWMGGSIDNFWLVEAVRFGIPGFLFIAGGFLSACFGLGRLRNLSLQVAQCRKGLIITICGLAIALCTVHVWDAPYVLIVFLLGSGMWMFDHRSEVALAPAPRKTLIPMGSSS
jgi:O-antigen ligase